MSDETRTTRWHLDDLGREWRVTIPARFLGEEIFTVHSNVLTWERRFFGVELARDFAVAEMRNLRVRRVPGKRWLPIARNGLIVFDYQNYSGRIGVCLDEAEAKALVYLMCEKFPALRK